MIIDKIRKVGIINMCAKSRTINIFNYIDTVSEDQEPLDIIELNRTIVPKIDQELILIKEQITIPEWAFQDAITIDDMIQFFKIMSSSRIEKNQKESLALQITELLEQYKSAVDNEI